MLKVLIYGLGIRVFNATDLPQVTDKLYHNVISNIPRHGLESNTTLVVIGMLIAYVVANPTTIRS